MERGGQRDTAVDEPTTGTPVDSLDVATATHEVSTKDASAESSALVSLPGQPRRSPRRSLTSSLAWSALLIAGVRIGGGLLLERAAYGMFGYLGSPPSPVIRPENSSIADGFLHWDAGYYLEIARHGYQPGVPRLSAFYPLYPYLTRAVTKVTTMRTTEALLAVSWISLFMAVWGVMRLTALIFPGTKAWRSGVLLAFFPVSVFLLAGYAESLYMALFAWTLVALLERRPWLAAILAAFVAVTRIEGVLLILAVVGWSVQDELTHRRHSIQGNIARIAGLCAVSLAPLFAYLLFIGQRYGHIFEELKINANWHRHLNWPLYPLFYSLKLIFRHGIHGPQAANIVATYLVDDAVMVLAIIGFVALCLIVRQRRDLWWLLPPVLIDLIIIASDQPYGKTPEAWARNAMLLVPLYIVASRIKSEVGWSTLLAGSTLMAALFQIVFNVGFWLT